ncbi:MAG: hypothetical protein ABL885_03675 [Methylophilaceae bacterium]
MPKDSTVRLQQIRQMIAQQAARMMAEDGISDFAYAKKKAGRQLGAVDLNCLPTNAQIEEEIKLFHEIYQGEEQPATLLQLRNDALLVMKMLEKFNPFLTGSVLDGTAGRYAETHIHLFVDSLKDVEMFLLNNQLPYESDEKSYRTSSRGGADKKGNGRKKVPVFTLDGPNGLIKLSVFEVNDVRTGTMHSVSGGHAAKADVKSVQALIDDVTAAV